MSGTCLAVGAAVMMLAVPEFTLSWRHSVERVLWSETWAVGEAALSLGRVAVKGSGAGMEPAPHARLENGWWVWEGELQTRALNLAASGATVSGWEFCADGACRSLGAVSAAPITIAPCAAGSFATAGVMPQ
jgi:hypothetical protein